MEGQHHAKGQSESEGFIMGEIKKATQGSLAKNNKLNEAIGVINAMAFNLTVRPGVGDETPQLIIADNNATLIVSAGGGGGGSGGGDTIDVILCVNGEPFNATLDGVITGPVV